MQEDRGRDEEREREERENMSRSSKRTKGTSDLVTWTEGSHENCTSIRGSDRYISILQRLADSLDNTNDL